MRIMLVTDAWRPQTNGVVRTLERTVQELERIGHEVRVISPDLNRTTTFSWPPYPEIKLDLFARWRVVKTIKDFAPDCIHIVTEGPVGWAARRCCLRLGKPFTTSYHTRFPEYISQIIWPFSRLVRAAAYGLLRRFHKPSSAVMVATQSLTDELQQRKFRRLVRWSRGVDTKMFTPLPSLREGEIYKNLPRPILLCVGRVSKEKKLDLFLSADVPGSKVIIGDGPILAALKHTYPTAHFLGALQGEELARHYAAADLFVFPSDTDTFGLVLLEAAASGLRIAARPVTGPVDILSGPQAQKFSALDHDVTTAITKALALPDDPSLPRNFAEGYSWQACTEQFIQHLQASTPQAVKRIMRLHNLIHKGWQRMLALTSE